MALRWKKPELRAILDGVGSFGWQVLQRRSGLSDERFGGVQRSKAAISAKINREFGGGGITRGSYSVLAAMKETGYSESQLTRASEALNQRWTRTARGGNFLISAEQLEDMTTWLAQDFWSKKLHLYACRQCGTKSVPHFSGGLCGPCFRKLRKYAATRGVALSVRRLRQLAEGTTLDDRLTHALAAGLLLVRVDFDALLASVGIDADQASGD